MILTFLGTSAANAFPEAFCRCDNCLKARELGGKSLRKRSAALINDDLLIDLGPDIHSAAALHRRPLSRVQYCLQTHAHADHLDPSHFMSRSPGFGVSGAPRLHFFASAGTAQRAAALLERNTSPLTLFDQEIGEKLNLKIHLVEPFQSFSAGDYQVTAFPANHDPSVDPLLYALSQGGHSIFYGTDTSVLSEEVWQGFHDRDLKFNLVILDHTYGPGDKGSSDHLNAEQFIEQFTRMEEEDLLADGARMLATHIAHETNPAFPELSAFANARGYEIAYDGLTIQMPDPTKFLHSLQAP